MSTRVHELAKELGLKSPDLLDRIQKWGLDVKVSALASLDPSMVDRIKQLIQDPGSKPSSPPQTQSPPAAKPAPPVSSSPSETPPIRTTAPSAPRPVHAPPVPPAPAPERVATPAPPSATVAAPPVSPPSRQEAPAPPPPAAMSGTPTTSDPPATAAAPLARHGGLSAPPRSGGGAGGGPLSGHTPHRSGTSTGPRPGGGQTSQHDLRPNPTTPPPLKRSDYMSSAGIRQPSQRTSGNAMPPRRPGDEQAGQAGDGGRRDASRGTSRPLPTVAASSSPSAPPRRPDGPRPGAGGGPEAKTQRPEKRYTREELLAMMKGGPQQAQGPAAAGARGPAGTGTRPGLTSRPTGPTGTGPQAPRPGPPGSPAMRRPATSGLVAPPAPPPTGTDEEEERKNKLAGRLGTPADRAGRRAKRNERATERRVTSPLPASTLLTETEEESRRSRGGRRSGRGGHRVAVAPARKSHAQIEPPINVRSLSEAIGVRAADLIRKMMNGMGQMVTINANLEDDTATMLALEFGVELEVVRARTAEDDLLDAFTPEETSELLVDRPPVITILGHVDHGKTSLLDRIRKSNVVKTESGGITQHIGAYQVQHEGKSITFVDTPGHEAFTAMRARGANVTDIVVLVVAADDGVMPQTQEAIAHAKAADVPIVIALNKIDLPNVNLNKIYGELAQQDLAPEEYGGDTPVVKTSALTGLGIPELLEMLGIVAELRCADKLKANPSRSASGTCLESSISEGRGVVATVLVQDGTMKVGDVIVCGDGFGRVRALFDDTGHSIAEAGPSMPVEVSGLDAVPTAGEKFAVVPDISRAREVAETRRLRTRGVALGDRQTVTLENLYSKMAEQKVKSLNLILKADVQGSLEALTKELEKLQNAEVPVRILLKGVGGISESDILLADASQAIVIGFRVAPEDRALAAADEKKIDIRRYDIIYQVTDEIKKAVEGMLVPEIKEVHLGRAVVRQVFRISKVGAVAGCFVTQGLFDRSAKVRLIREGREIYKGSLEALKRFKDDVKEVREGFECGIKIGNFDDIKVDDMIEAYRIDVIKRTLDS